MGISEVIDYLAWAETSIPLRDFPKQSLHSKAQCKETRKAGGPKGCVIHRPTVHRLTGSAQVVRTSSLIEDICQHGAGHPNPDSAAFLEWRSGSNHWWVHGCDGCCGPVDIQ